MFSMMPFMMSPRTPGGGEFGKTVAIIVRIITTAGAIFCLGFAAYAPWNWHTNFPEDGWINIGWAFTAVFMCFALMLLIYGYGSCRIRKD